MSQMQQDGLAAPGKKTRYIKNSETIKQNMKLTLSYKLWQV